MQSTDAHAHEHTSKCCMDHYHSASVLQVSEALHSSPLTARAATAAGLITGAKYQDEATQTILHNSAQPGNPAKLLALHPSTELDSITARLLVKGKHVEISKQITGTAAAPEADSDAMKSVQAAEQDAERIKSSDSSVQALLDKIQEHKLHARTKKVDVLTDTLQGVHIVTRASVSISKYIQVSVPHHV